MGDNSRSQSQDMLHILGFGSICKACKSFLSKCYPEKNILFFKKSANKAKPKPIDDDVKSTKLRNQISKKKNSDNRDEENQESDDEWIRQSHQWSPLVPPNTGPAPNLLRTATHGASSLSRSASKKIQRTFSRSMSQKNTAMDASSSSSSGPTLRRSLSKTASTRILYSNSQGLVKPPPVEKQLDCTIDELCFGCVKKMNITRDAVTDDGQIVDQEKVLTIKVKPGWRRGTKITFDNKGHEMPGSRPGDVIFVVAEEEHPVFKRQEDDLRLELEIPLVEALSGCTRSVPLLGGETMSLTIDDVIHPGYEKIIEGQGMARQNEPETRGNLIITFSVKFPEELTQEQRSSAADILQQAC